MALERKLLAIPPIALTGNGTALGVVTVADTVGFLDKQLVILQSNTQPQSTFQIKQVISSTQMVLGPTYGPLSINNYSDVSAFLVSDSAKISSGEQDKTVNPSPDNHYVAIYQSSPVNADRVIPVDPYGVPYGPSNPQPVTFDGTISIGEVEIKGSPSGDLLNVNPDGSINVNVVQTPVTGQTVKSFYAQVSNVVSGAETTLVTYTVPVGYTAVLERVSVSGENIARYDVIYNSAIFDTKRTMFGGEFNADFDYTTGTSNGFSLNSSDIITVQVLHNRPYPGTFNARIQVLEIV